MASGINRVTLIGTLGKDPEMRYTQGGQAVATFSLATNESWTDKEGQKNDRTEWHRIVVWGKLAELCGQYLSKGRQAYIEGKIASRKYQDKQGIERTSYEIVAREVQFIGSRNDRTEAPAQAPAQAPSQMEAMGYEREPGDDLPF